MGRGAGTQSKSFCLTHSRLSLLRCLNLFCLERRSLGRQQCVRLGVAVSAGSQRSRCPTFSIILILILYTPTISALSTLAVPARPSPHRHHAPLIAQPLPRYNHYIPMKHIFLLGLIALAAAQFSPPDFSQIGEAIKNGVVEAEQKVEHLAKEEIQNAEDLINKGLDKINEAVNPATPTAPPAPQPQPAEAPKETIKEPAVIVNDFAVFVPISSQPQPQPAPEATANEVEQDEVKPIEQKERAQEKPLPKPEGEKPVEGKEKAPREHKRGSKHDRKPHARREEASSDSSESSEDIEEKRPQKHEKKDRKEKHERKERHEFTTEEIKQWREEREQRIKAKEERMKKYEKHGKNIERNQDEISKEWKRQDKPRKEHKRAQRYEDPKLTTANERIKLATFKP